MKIILFLCVISLFLVVPGDIRAECLTKHHHVQQSKKILIQPQDIIINESGIFVLIDGACRPVDTIISNSEGLYCIPIENSAWCRDEAHGGKCHYCEGCFKWYCEKRCKCG